MRGQERRPRRLDDLPADRRERIRKKLRQILPLCEELSADDMSWITACCLKYQIMKIEEEERAST